MILQVGGVDLRYVGCITSSGRGFDIAFVGGDEIMKLRFLALDVIKEKSLNHMYK